MSQNPPIIDPSQPEKFKNKYRIQSARLPSYDYASNGAYFITICTKNREHFLGEIKNENMQYSEIGKIACDCWQQIPDHFSFVKLGEWVVMPNHVHGVIFIGKNDPAVRPVDTVETQDLASQNNTASQNNVKTQDMQTQDLASLQKPKNKFGPPSKNLASITRGFKIGVTKYARTNTDIFDVWQPRFYDRIIRNENELHRISQYIISNPQNWENDDYF